jgi:hypothetical protein
MITLTAVWTDWEQPQADGTTKTVHPTPGRDRPLVVTCSTPFTAAALIGVLTRLGCTITREETAP